MKNDGKYVGLTTAARLLEQEHPELSMSADSLRRRCVANLVKYRYKRTNGVMRKVRYQVNMEQLVKDLRKEFIYA